MCALFTGAPGAPGQGGGRGQPGKGGNDNILMYFLIKHIQNCDVNVMIKVKTA
jgi:hypothetical protein